jgi:hypothetical protein
MATVSVDARVEAQALCQAASKLFGDARLSGSVAAALLRARLTRLPELQRLDTPAAGAQLASALLRLLDRLGTAALGKSSPATAVLRREFERIRERAGALVAEATELRGKAAPVSRGRPATKERPGINPFTKQPITIPKFPAGARRSDAALARIESILTGVTGGNMARIRTDRGRPLPKKAAQAIAERAAPKAPEKKTAPKKAPAKRAPAKRAAPKKAPAKKAAAKKAASKRAAPKKKGERRAKHATGRARTRSEWSPVLLGVAAPRAVQPGQSFTARFAAYVKHVEAEVTKQLQAMADVEASVGFATSDETQWKQGTSVSVRVTGEHFTVQPAEAAFKWNGHQNLVHFLVKAKPDAPLGKTQLVFEASIAGISVAFIAIDVTLGEATSGKASSAELARATSVPYAEAFASYSSEDTERVADHLSGFNAGVRGTRVFMDCLDLRRGEDWQRQLAEQIAKTDMFLLFWSKSAAKSQWVDWEWRQAHGANKAMQAFRLDQPLPKLPAELAKLHAGDRFQLARAAHAAVSGKRTRT